MLVNMPRIVERAAWVGIVGLINFVIVPAVMAGAWLRGLTSERRIRG